MTDTVITVEGVAKKYRVGVRNNSMVRESMMDIARASWHLASRVVTGPRPSADRGEAQDVWALRGVDFTVKRGEVLGIVGANGAGKSTLLKLLSRITEPTKGRITIKGRVASLLEVGTGFHYELTGRENVFLNGAILGMSRAEISRKFDEIAAFAEIDKYLDTPVKRYSSGMQMRLAFSVAAHLEPEVLIVDEVLAVGDAQFQKKSLGKMSEVSQHGRTVLFVSHNMAAVTQLCSEAIWLERGQLKMRGSSSEIVSTYLASTSTPSASWVDLDSGRTDAIIQLTRITLLSNNGQASAILQCGEPFKIAISYTVRQATRDCWVYYRLGDLQGNIVWTSRDTDMPQLADGTRELGSSTAVCTVPAHVLRPGRYVLSVGLVCPAWNIRRYFENAITFEVSPVGYMLDMDRRGVIAPLLPWHIDRGDIVAG